MSWSPEYMSGVAKVCIAVTIYETGDTPFISLRL